jgi:beta-aspartyl-dipeptidase (metallo-type)
MTMGFTLIKNGSIYAPSPIGKKDILVCENSILAIDDEISKHSVITLDPNALIIDAEGMLVAPGFIDCHIHFNGAGGENGPQFRTPPLQLSSFIKAGITTAVAPLGTDGVCRSLRELLAKCRGLDAEGITAYMYTGSYGYPPVSITENVLSDIVFIDKIIGTKIALSDHRSSHPTVAELRHLISDSRVGGMLAGKVGLVMAHMGDEEGGLSIIKEALSGTDIPKTQILPTHVNRNSKLFTEGLEYCANGGYIDITADLTTSITSNAGFISPVDCIVMAYNKKIPLSSLTLSSDGNGSMPIFNSAKEVVGMAMGEPRSLFAAIKDILYNTNIPKEDVISLVTKNVAEHLKLTKKGRIAKGGDADILLISPSDFSLQYVVAKGIVLMEKGNVVRKGTFESLVE